MSLKTFCQSARVCSKSTGYGEERGHGKCLDEHETHDRRMKLTLGDLAQVGLRSAEPDLVLDVLVRLRLVLQRDNAALVVRTRALVVERHRAVPLEVRHRGDGCVHWQLTVVHTETVPT